jgi:hypothetical protein
VSIGVRLLMQADDGATSSSAGWWCCTPSSQRDIDFAQMQLDAKAASRWDPQTALLKGVASGSEAQLQSFADALTQWKWHAFADAAIEATAFANGVGVLVYNLMDVDGSAALVQTRQLGPALDPPRAPFCLLGSARDNEWDILVRRCFVRLRAAPLSRDPSLKAFAADNGAQRGACACGCVDNGCCLCCCYARCS